MGKTIMGKTIRAQVIARDGLVCKLCSCVLLEIDVTLDHVIPRSKGGPTSLANLRVACADCNNHRGNDEPLPERKRRRGKSRSKGVYEAVCAT